MQNLINTEVVCDNCRRLFNEQRKRYFCEHCKTYHHICKSCAAKQPKCSSCGITLSKRMEPRKRNSLHYIYN